MKKTFLIFMILSVILSFALFVGCGKDKKSGRTSNVDQASTAMIDGESAQDYYNRFITDNQQPHNSIGYSLDLKGDKTATFQDTKNNKNLHNGAWKVEGVELKLGSYTAKGITIQGRKCISVINVSGKPNFCL